MSDNTIKMPWTPEECAVSKNITGRFTSISSRADAARSARIAEARAVAQYARKLAENGIRKPRGQAADDARMREILAKLDDPEDRRIAVNTLLRGDPEADE